MLLNVTIGSIARNVVLCGSLLAGLSWSWMARAEQGCPDGLIPVGQAPGPICVPMQGYGGPQASRPVAQPRQPRGPQWSYRYGAIAADYAHGKFGTASNMSSDRKAVSAALAQCRAKGGIAEECKKGLHSWANGCGAVVWGDQYAVTRSAASEEEASQAALQECGQNTADCRVYYSGCSLPVMK
ncbi:DUF4189 domain-containing protein [Lysobacter sp. 5GHs7-4]|uniref:DUF4189 domain-containing protein n=1 Tax=Lysobacter sp. 5GHs7-4 TaxID=2904253 RepID=UPI001E2B73CB|nr:DUF4189 domain-containing protein [Lysobacter sp. 5GHs7-4]UHQ21637.1 DUF4189 domain-containing protein [Lysobacter sp. 5GHs7-4]